MDTVTTLLVAVATVEAGLVGWLTWLTVRGVRWGQVERVKLTLAEQEEALSSLFDKLNTVLARWRKREQREKKRQDDDGPASPAEYKLELYRRAAPHLLRNSRPSNGLNRLPSLFDQEPQEQEKDE